MAKRSTMFSLILSLWVCSLLYFNPRLLALLIGSENLAAKLCLFLFVLFLNLFWFYAFFHIVIAGFSYVRPRSHCSIPAPTKQLARSPKVAILYATCNDFQKEAVFSCLNQDYSAYHLFILDDSSINDYQEQINGIANRYPHKVTVLRRDIRAGFKAGNLNHALRNIDSDYEYFSVSDADTVLTPDYLSSLLTHIAAPNIAFAQSNQKTNPNQKTIFSQFMGINTDLHFQHYASTKNRFGFVMWYGHGALMRRDIWEKVGGFPEVVSEDLAYSIRIREAGYEGVFVEDVFCYEDFPPTYQQYRKRNEKWIRGTAQCLLKFYPSFIRAKHIPWFEKLDVLISGLSLLLDFPFVLLLLLVGIVLPLFYVHFQFSGPMLRMPIVYEKSFLGMAARTQSNIFFSWDVFLLMLATIFAPLLSAIADYFWRPKQMVRYLASYIFCFFSLLVTSTIHLLSFLFTGKAIFPVTGEKLPLLPCANLPWISGLEIILGVCFWIIGITTQNIWFLPVSVALISGPCLVKWSLNRKFIRYVIFAPFVMTLGIIYLIGRNLPGP